MNFPFLCSNILSAQACGVCISLLIQYTRLGIFLIKSCYSKRSYWTKSSKWLNWTAHIFKILLTCMQSRVGRSFRNICFTDDAGYFQLSLPQSCHLFSKLDLLPNLFLHLQHDEWHMWSMICFPPGHTRLTQNYLGFVVAQSLISMLCIVYRCLSFDFFLPWRC